MPRLLLTVLVGALVAAAPASAQPFPRDRDYDRGRDIDRDRGPSRESRDLVNYWFERDSGQQADPNLLVIWSRRLDQSNNPDKVLAWMLGESVYYDRSGDNPRGFVLHLFRDLTGRDPSRSEFDQWMNRLYRNGGESPDSVDRTNLAYDMLRRYPQSKAPPDRSEDYDYRSPDYRR